MSGVKLLAAGMTMTLPAESPYDRELVREHLTILLRRYGSVRLSTARRAAWLTMTEVAFAGVCSHCRRPLERAVELARGAVACVACATHEIVTERERPAA